MLIFHVTDIIINTLLQVGDGTTSVVVLASELLREAEKLVAMKLHPQTIIAGYRQATDIAREALKKSTRDNSSNPDKFRDDLLKVVFCI